MARLIARNGRRGSRGTGSEAKGDDPVATTCIGVFLTLEAIPDALQMRGPVLENVGLVQQDDGATVFSRDIFRRASTRSQNPGSDASGASAAA